jgi:hypothetical protein
MATTTHILAPETASAVPVAPCRWSLVGDRRFGSMDALARRRMR